MTSRILLPAIVLIASSCWQSMAAAQDPAPDMDGATRVVETLHATLLDTMRGADELGLAGRQDKLRPVLVDVFDFATIARIVLGSHWRNLDAEQQRSFIARFSALTVATYADNFSGYDDERFATETVEAQRNSVVVKTSLHTRDEAIRLDYMLRETDSGWRIVNVLAQGVSDIALKRADYGAVINSDGSTPCWRGLMIKSTPSRRIIKSLATPSGRGGNFGEQPCLSDTLKDYGLE